MEFPTHSSGLELFGPTLEAKYQQCEMSQAVAESLEWCLILKQSRHLTLDSICHASSMGDVLGPDSGIFKVFLVKEKNSIIKENYSCLIPPSTFIPDSM